MLSTLDTEMLRATLELEPVGVAVYDSDLRFVYVNRAFEALGPGPKLGRTLAEVWPEMAADAEPRMRRVLATGEPWCPADWPIEVETHPGVREQRRYTFAIKRLQAGARLYLVSTGSDSTAEFESREHAAHELELNRLLLRASQALTERVELERVLTRLAEVLLASTAHARSFVLLSNEEGRRFESVASSGAKPIRRGETYRLDDLAPMTRATVERRRRAVIDFDRLPPAERGRALAREGSHLLLVVPLLWRDGLVGVIGVDDPDARREFTEREIETVEAVAAQAATAIQNARLFETATRARSLADTLDEINRSIHSSLQPSEALQQALETAGRALGASAGALVVTGTGMTEPIMQFGLPPGMIGNTVPGAMARFGELLSRTRQPAVIDEDRMSSVLDREYTERYGIRTVLAIPLLTRGELIGGIGYGLPARHEFTDVELDFARKLAASVSLTLENAELYRRQSEAMRLANALSKLDDLVHSSLDTEQVMRGLLEQASHVLGCQAVAVVLEERGQWPVRYAHGLEAGALGRPLTPEEPGVIARKIVDKGDVLAVEDAFADTHVGHMAALHHFRAFAGVPLTVRGAVLGVVLFLQLDAPRRYTPAEVEFVRRLGSSLALSLNNARLFESERETARLSEALTVIDHDIHATMSTDEMLGRVVVEAARVLGCETGALDLRENGRWVVRYLYNFPPEQVGRSFSDSEVPFAAMAAESQQPVVIDDALNDPRITPEIQREYDFRSMMAIPLIVREKVIGLLFVNFHRTQHRFSQHEVDFARRLSASLGLAVANARLYAKEHGIADMLQEALLALPDRLPGIEFAHAYRSATETARVGGDFYDLFEVARDRIGMTVGDISGHGVESAVLTSLVKNTVRAHAIERGKTPAEVMECANAVLYSDSPTEIFATVFFGLLDLNSGELAYTNAGHTSGVCVCPETGIRTLGPTGPIVGGFEKVEFGTSSDTLRPGDLLFLYTDGLTEARRGRELFGEERLVRVLAERAPMEPKDAVRTVVDAVTSFAGGSLSDDLAALALKWVGPLRA